MRASRLERVVEGFSCDVLQKRVADCGEKSHVVGSETGGRAGGSRDKSDQKKDGIALSLLCQ